MYQKFVVSAIEPDEANACVRINFTMDIDDETVNDASVYLTETISTLNTPIVKSQKSVDRKTITLSVEEFKVNTTYEVHITKDVQSVVGSVINHEYRKSFTINSPVDSSIEVLAPVDYEEMEALMLNIRELPGESGRLTSVYRVQVATDVTFLDVVLEEVFKERNKISLKLPPRQQYFLRVRAENEESDIGNWSERRTFTLLAPKKSDIVDDEIIFEEDFHIVGYPENGHTPKSFLFEFDDEIDPASIDVAKILVLKKKV